MLLSGSNQVYVSVLEGFDEVGDGPGWIQMLFGIEMEILVQVKDASKFIELDDWYKVVEYLSQLLLEYEVQNYKHNSDAAADYTIWSLTKDGSIRRDAKAGIWGIELVSPIQMNGVWPAWFDDYKAISACLRDHFQTFDSPSCGTHIHISPMTEHGWFDDLEGLKRVAQAVVYFERCIDSIMPKDRLKNGFCKSNRYNPFFRDLDLQSVLQSINAAETPVSLAHLMCPYGNDNSAPKYYRWNFISLTREDVYESITNQRKGTLEFRQPPRSLNPDHAKDWSQFAVGFVVGARLCMNHPKGVNPSQPASLATLEKMVKTGIQVSLMDTPGTNPGISHLFSEKEKLDDGPWEPEPAAAPSQEDIQQGRAGSLSDDAKAERFWMASMAGLLDKDEDH